MRCQKVTSRENTLLYLFHTCLTLVHCVAQDQRVLITFLVRKLQYSISRYYWQEQWLIENANKQCTCEVHSVTDLATVMFCIHLLLKLISTDTFLMPGHSCPFQTLHNQSCGLETQSLFCCDFHFISNYTV